MSNVAILSIKPEYSRKILAGTKTIELRRSPMRLKRDDIIIVYESAPIQSISFWFSIAKIETIAVDEMWIKHGDKLGIDYKDYLSYFDGCEKASGLYIGEVHRLNPPISLADIKAAIPDFVPPQGILWIRVNGNRFKKLLKIMSPSIPIESLPQLSLFSDP